MEGINFAHTINLMPHFTASIDLPTIPNERQSIVLTITNILFLRPLEVEPRCSTEVVVNLFNYSILFSGIQSISLTNEFICPGVTGVYDKNI